MKINDIVIKTTEDFGEMFSLIVEQKSEDEFIGVMPILSHFSMQMPTRALYNRDLTKSTQPVRLIEFNEDRKSEYFDSLMTMALLCRTEDDFRHFEKLLNEKFPRQQS